MQVRVLSRAPLSGLKRAAAGGLTQARGSRDTQPMSQTTSAPPANQAAPVPGAVLQVLLTLSGSAAGTGDIEEYRVGDEVRFVLF